MINTMIKGKQVKKSYWKVGVGKAAIVGGWRSGHSMDVTFKKILNEVF